MAESISDADEAGPRLRREFIGMMFAITVGEIGLQTAALVQAGRPLHFLVAYSHLFLATFVVAASWVGWSRAFTKSGQEDVTDLFEWPFVVLLLDMAMVVTYFILVRTVDFSGQQPHRIDSASEVAWWHVVIFALYLIWDVVTKVLMAKGRRNWFRNVGHRMLPTIACLIASVVLWLRFARADEVHWLTADFALLSLVVLFRALKHLSTAVTQGRKVEVRRRLRWVAICVAGVALGYVWTVHSWPMPRRISESIRSGNP